MEAYVLIMTAAGSSPDILPEIQAIENVERANIVAGEFDIIAIMEADSSRDLLRIVTDRIHSLDGVGNTRTAIVLQ